jgi:hypothetical protein
MRRGGHAEQHAGQQVMAPALLVADGGDRQSQRRERDHPSECLSSIGADVGRDLGCEDRQVRQSQ